MALNTGPRHVTNSKSSLGHRHTHTLRKCEKDTERDTHDIYECSNCVITVLLGQRGSTSSFKEFAFIRSARFFAQLRLFSLTSGNLLKVLKNPAVVAPQRRGQRLSV